jgi:hypothetical protein
MALFVVLAGAAMAALYVRAERRAQQQMAQERAAREEAERQREDAERQRQEAESVAAAKEQEAAEARRQAEQARQEAEARANPPTPEPQPAPRFPTKCQPGDMGLLREGARLRSSPYHNSGPNVLATWKGGARVRITGVERGEARESTGRIYWYVVEIISGSCGNCDYGDRDCGDDNTYSCRNKNRGYIHADAIKCN